MFTDLSQYILWDAKLSFVCPPIFLCHWLPQLYLNTDLFSAHNLSVAAPVTADPPDNASSKSLRHCGCTVVSCVITSGSLGSSVSYVEARAKRQELANQCSEPLENATSVISKDVQRHSCHGMSYLVFAVIIARWPRHWLAGNSSALAVITHVASDMWQWQQYLLH